MYGFQCPPWTTPRIWRWVVGPRTCPSASRVYGYSPRWGPCVWPAEAPAYGSQGLADKNLALAKVGCCHWQRLPADARCHVRVVALKGHPLILPDGHECVATGGPHIFFILFSFFLPLLGSSAEPGVLKLARVVTVKQAIVELEHRGVQMIALHE